MPKFEGRMVRVQKTGGAGEVKASNYTGVDLFQPVYQSISGVAVG